MLDNKSLKILFVMDYIIRHQYLENYACLKKYF